MKQPPVLNILNAAVIVAALGYFVDIFDLLLFGFVRQKSLLSLGFTKEQAFDLGISLQNWQMGGMLLGGLVWGVLGDKLGRVSVLYFSIGLYSVANILNGMVTSYESYALYRCIAGIGLAGELGAGITLVSEVLPKNKRGLGTILVTAVGFTGAILAWAIDKQFDWRICYYTGGGLGMLLLLMRISIAESGIFQHAKQQTHVSRGNFFALFTDRSRFIRFMRCIFIGSTTWFTIGVLVFFAPEFGKMKGVEGILAGNAIALCYSGIIVGDIASGLLSQYLKSRIKVMAMFLGLNILAVLMYLSIPFSSPGMFYAAIFFLGVSVGFWVIFVTIAAEQFGTNLRSTVATSVPNFARGMLVPINESFKYLKSAAVTGSVFSAAYIIGGVTVTMALIALYGMKETFQEDLNYLEPV
jgi:MFS family permease